MPFNIKFNYLYRDASNYKQFGNIIFSNPNSLEVDLIKDIIVGNLFDGEFFNAQNWSIPPLFFENKNIDDHEWHEFEDVEMTNQPSHSNLAIENLLDIILLS